MANGKWQVARGYDVAMRREYTQHELTEADAGDDPRALFDRWFDQATQSCPGQWYEPNTMALATVGADGVPSNRIVLLKSFDQAGFVFFTNYDSRKAGELAGNANAALAFHWPWLERQVRAVGAASKIDRAATESYFASRPRGSQLGAWVSDQSEPMSRQAMADRLAELEAKFADGDVPCPPNWGGYVVAPRQIEFWQGRPSRLHDRLLYTLIDGQWQRQRIGP
jgi:pyridoxamine 5'-phosphate oxidase